MARFKVEVKDLGRNKVSFSEVVEKIDTDTLYGIVKPHLLSSGLSFTTMKEGEWGIVYAGFYPVGKIRFISM